MSIHDLKFTKQYNVGWVWEERYVWRCPWAWTHSETTVQNVTISFLNKPCNFQCHPSGGWHCSVGLSLMQLSAIKRLVPESCKVQEAEQNRKEEKRREKKSFSVFMKPSSGCWMYWEWEPYLCCATRWKDFPVITRKCVHE